MPTPTTNVPQEVSGSLTSGGRGMEQTNGELERAREGSNWGKAGKESTPGQNEIPARG